MAQPDMGCHRWCTVLSRSVPCATWYTSPTFPPLLCFLEGSTLELSFGTDVERLDNASVHSGDDVHRAIQVCFTDTCLPCIRKTAFHSRLTVAYDRNGETHEDLFALAQIGDGMSIAVELAEISPLTH